MNSVSSYPTAARAAVPTVNRRPDHPGAYPTTGAAGTALQSPPPPPPLSEPHLGEELDPAYLLDGLEDLTSFAEISRGAYSVVYSAQAPNGRTVAVKIDRRPLSDDEQRRRFQQEVTAAGRVSKHPCVVQMYSAGFTSLGHPYVVMEHCRESLADFLARERSLFPEDVRQIGVRIATALAVAHSEGIIHRDVKPANILISQQGQVVLADFGLSALNPQPTPGQPISIMATPAYAPLEVFQLQEVGPAADVYSLAATLYALLRGAPPRFPLEATRPLDINEVADLLHEPVDHLPGVSPLMVEMIRTALINNAEGRPAANEFADYLESIPQESTGVFQAVEDPALAQPSPPREGTFGAFSAPVAEAEHPPPAEARAAIDEALGVLPENISSPNTAPIAQTGVMRPPMPVPEPVEPEPYHAGEWDTLTADTPQGRSFPQTENPYEPPVTDSPMAAAAPASSSFASPDSRPVIPEQAPAPDDTTRWSNFASGAVKEREPEPKTEAGGGTGTTRRERRLATGESNSSMGQLIGIGVVALLIVIGLVFGAIRIFGGDSSTPLEDNASSDSYQADCTLDMEGVDCVPEPTCYNGVPGDDIEELACDNPHTWEAYAVGQLPEEVNEPTHQAARDSDVVADACLDGQREDGPLDDLIGPDRVSWFTDIHLPTADEFDDGDRTFMCIARQADEEPQMGHRFARS